MKVTAIKQQVKNENRVSIFVDGKYAFSLTLDQLLQEKLKKSLELDEGRLKNLKKLSDEGKIRAKALDWVLMRPHSEKELKEYLYRKQVENDLSQGIIEEFKEKNYINDENFSRWFAENRIRKHKSTREIESELRAKGISPVTIQSVVTELGLYSKEQEILGVLVNKLREKPRYTDKQKLIKYLMSKGFKYSDIKEQLQQ